MAVAKKEDVTPRISRLESSQEAISKDLLNLSHSVKEQGQQLTSAILSLSSSQSANYNALSEKIGLNGQTDWQSFWSMVGVLILICGGLMTHVYVQFNSIDKEQLQINEQIRILRYNYENSEKESLRERSVNTTKINALENMSKANGP